MKTFCVSILFFVMVLSQSSFSQTFAGGGFAAGRLSLLGLDEAQGVSFYLIKEFKIDGSRFRIDPALNIAILFSAMNSEANPFLATMSSISPNVSYEIIQSKRVVIAPFVGPYANWVIRNNTDNIYSEPLSLNHVQYGLEFGLGINVLVKEKFSIKIIPFNYQVARFGGDGETYFLKFTSSILFSL